MLDYPDHVFQGPPEQAPACCDQAHIIGTGLTERLPAVEDGREAIEVDQSDSGDPFLRMLTGKFAAVPDLAVIRQDGIVIPEDLDAAVRMGVHWQRQGDQLVPVSDATLDEVDGQLVSHTCS